MIITNVAHIRAIEWIAIIAIAPHGLKKQSIPYAKPQNYNGITEILAKY